MNEIRARDLILTALNEIAPEIDTTTLDPDVSLRDGADLDSMDFLAYVSTVADAIHTDVPEDDYGQLDTVTGAVAYVVAHTN